MKLKSKWSVAVFCASGLYASSSLAGEVTTGEFVLDFDEAALFALPTQLVNSGWFDEAASAELSEQDMRISEPDDMVPDVFRFSVYGRSVSTPVEDFEGRSPVPSSFSYSGDPRSGVGVIGLAGVHIMSGAFAGKLSFGDYDLSYEADRVGNGANGSGWVLTNHVSFATETFDLANVEMILLDDNNFSLSGDVVLTSGAAFLLQGMEGDDVGDFSFTTMPSAAELASYSFEQQMLTLPIVKVGSEYYSAKLRLVGLSTGEQVLELVSASKTAPVEGNVAQYIAAQGILDLPEVELLQNGIITGKVKAEMQVIEGVSPLRFSITRIEDI